MHLDQKRTTIRSQGLGWKDLRRDTSAERDVLRKNVEMFIDSAVAMDSPHIFDYVRGPTYIGLV